MGWTASLASTWRAGARIESRAAMPKPPPMTKISGSNAWASVTSPCPSASPTARSSATASASPSAAACRARRLSAGRAVGTLRERAVRVLARVRRDREAEGRARRVRLQVAVARARPGAGWAVAVDHDVAELRAGAGRAAERPAVDDHAAADARAEGDGHGVPVARCRAAMVLGERGAVGVVVDPHGVARLTLQHPPARARPPSAGWTVCTTTPRRWSMVPGKPTPIPSRSSPPARSATRSAI